MLCLGPNRRRRPQAAGLPKCLASRPSVPVSPTPAARQAAGDSDAGAGTAGPGQYPGSHCQADTLALGSLTQKSSVGRKLLLPRHPLRRIPPCALPCCHPLASLLVSGLGFASCPPFLPLPECDANPPDPISRRAAPRPSRDCRRLRRGPQATPVRLRATRLGTLFLASRSAAAC